MNEEERAWGAWLVSDGGEKREIGQGEGGRVCEYGVLQYDASACVCPMCRGRAFRLLRGSTGRDGKACA